MTESSSPSTPRTTEDTPEKPKNVVIQIDDKENGDNAPSGNHNEVHFMNDDKLGLAIQNAGRWSFGTIAVEVWVPSVDKTKLIHKGMWIEPAFALSEPSEALDRLTDESRTDYLGPIPLSPGEGLAGVLWAETGPTFVNRQSSSENQSTRRGILSSQKNLKNMQNNLTDMVTGRVQNWRDVGLLAIDPDQPYNERLKLLNKAGFGLAAGVPFDIRGYTGIVVYLSRATADLEKLRSPTNESYLHSAADMIGAILALGAPLARVSNDRKQERIQCIKRVKLKIQTIKTFDHLRPNKNNADVPQAKPEIENKTAFSRLLEWKTRKVQAAKSRSIMWAKKFRGGGMMPPPALPMHQAPVVFLGAFTQLIIVALISEGVEYASANKYSFIMGTLAAFAAMHYTLTAAPAAQPRNGIYGTIVSLVIALAFSYIPNFPPWLRVSLVPSLAIVAMAKFGCIHPPAAGATVAFSSGKLGWEDFGILLGAYGISIFLSTSINNMSQIRQYPTFWEFHSITNACCPPKKKNV